MSKSSLQICRHCGRPIETTDTGYRHASPAARTFSYCDIGDMSNHNRAEPKRKKDYIKDFIKCLK